MSDKINELVEALPERYQPIFGFENFTSEAERESSDRLAIVMNVANLMVKHLQRPLRVLDLGCAQGYFSLNLADISESIVGIDFLDKNVELCTGLAEYHHFDHIKFYENDIATFVSTLEPDTYDLVLGLNVFHHVCHAMGYDETKKIINKIASYSKVLLTELALKEEPLYWAASLPENVYSNLDDIAYHYTLQTFSTHLSDIKRPFIFSSNYLWCDGKSIGEFTSWKSEPHEYSQGYHLNSRRYYFSDNNVIKCYYFNNGQKESNIQEFHKEYNYYISGHTFPDFIPAIVDCSENEWQGIVVLEKFEGELLSSKIAQGVDLSHQHIISNLLKNIAELEKQGLYHTDLRIWNILLTDNNELNFIDIGSITTDSSTTSWPFNVFVDFIILIQDIVSANSADISAVRYPFLQDTWYNDPKVKQWITKIWGTPHSDWNFKLFLELWENLDLSSEAVNVEMHHTNNKYWMKLIETYLVFNPREEKFIDTIYQKNFLEYYNKLSEDTERNYVFLYSLDAKVKEFELENSRIHQSLDDKINSVDNKFATFSDEHHMKSEIAEMSRGEMMEKISSLQEQCKLLWEQVESIKEEKPSLINRIIRRIFPK
ncbi:methyltransferase domain-containing protein [Atlantibacter hermannii]|uniref:methyltransferase domain-containing protein n=1 Tax=Atlantibacter hermannii TaxID=565 RepID=UPI00164F6BFF|nr:methyltransferase domain-containing protein [Atlantibacter hermannii]